MSDEKIIQGMRIFYDVDTQNDFMDKNGALYVPGAEEIKPNLRRLTEYVDNNKMYLLGSVDMHIGTPEYRYREGELQRWGGPFPDHCMELTKGQRKIDETTRVTQMSRDWIENSHYITHDLSDLVDKKELNLAKKELTTGIHLATGSRAGIYFEKQANDVFTNPNFEAFLKKAEVKEAVVYGVATDYCVKDAVLGMQKRGIQCYVVTDAIAEITRETGKSALEAMVAAGAKLTTTDEVLKNHMRW